MRTKGEIEAAISEEISRFEQDYMGRGPKCIHVHLLDDLLLIRLRGVLAAAEQHLVKSLPAENGRLISVEQSEKGVSGCDGPNTPLGTRPESDRAPSPA